MMQVREVGAAEGFDLILPLVAQHHAEVETFTDSGELSVDREMYRRAEEDGRLITLVAELGSLVIGYCTTLLSRHLHYSNMVYAQSDALYVLPPFRGTRAGALLMITATDLAQVRGATVMMWHAKEGSKLGKMLPRHGYEVVDVVWGRRL